MDIDASSGEMGGLLIGKDLHVTRQHDQLGIAFNGNLPHARFSLWLGILGHGHMVEGNVANIGLDRGLTRMVGDDRDRIDVKLAYAPPVEKINKTMIKLADHDQSAARARL